QTAGINAIGRQVVVNDLRTTLRQTLVVGVGTDRVGITGNLHLDLRITLQRIHRLLQDGHRVGRRLLQRRRDVGLALARTVELEVHATQVDGDLLRAAVRAHHGAGGRARALVVAVVDAIVVVIQLIAGWRRRRGRGS